jgi:23S rRNA (cytosine1962-C5)-methyltransferase
MTTRAGKHHGAPLAVRVIPAAERAIRDGHPWLFADGIASVSGEALQGSIAVVFDRKNRFLAAGLYDPSSPIRVRVLAHGQPEQVGPDLFRDRLARALERRTGVLTSGTTAMRLLHGENDGMPGIVVDLYGPAAVVKIYSESWRPHLQDFEAALDDLLSPERIVFLQAGTSGGPPSARSSEGEGLPFLESGLHFEAYPVEGHKTGFYLDQRENRQRLEREVKGGRVLNLFAHTGAFSLYAARGGAQEVVSVDISDPALRQAERHFELNSDDALVAGCTHVTIRGDVFKLLGDTLNRGEPFDTIVVDPPSFAKAAAQRSRALKAYGNLTRMTLPLLRPGGLLVQASCSTRVDSEGFFSTVLTAARDAGSPLKEIARTGHPLDHPVGFPEGAYLKCLWARLPARGHPSRHPGSETAGRKPRRARP